MRVILSLSLLFWSVLPSARVVGFSASPLLGGVGLDRFRAICPADVSSIRQFDASLVVKDDTDTDTDTDETAPVWVAVYRSNQNQPSVFVRDEFFHAMKEATTDTSSSSSSSSSSSTIATSTSGSSTNSKPLDDKLETPMSLEKPVAVAQLRLSSSKNNNKNKKKQAKTTWILESMQCCLKKENLDETCDGGSEFVEALSVGVDSLLLHYLQQQTAQSQENEKPEFTLFEGSIRTKATLFNNKLFEERGFAEVEELCPDMATHVSTHDECLQKYAERSVSLDTINPGARERALQIVSLLGRLNRNQEEDDDEKLAESVNENENDDDEDDDDAFDPWANLKMQR